MTARLSKTYSRKPIWFSGVSLIRLNPTVILRLGPVASLLTRCELNAEIAAETDGAGTGLDAGRDRNRVWLQVGRIVLATAAVTLIAMFISSIFRSPASDTKTYASLHAINGTRWVSASVPTSLGSRIGSGSLKLAAGLVTVQFDVGAVVELEGPADFELISPVRCRLISGKLLATVRTDFKGFVVETPNAILTDQGTSFCVSVGQDGESKMQVKTRLRVSSV